MDTINRSNRNSKSSKDAELPERTGGLSRRSVLKTVLSPRAVYRPCW
jgi:hypothetical protein